ncbi:heterokaryon incompatibility protein-domain-containing protein [Alternaria rosae]|uniref:heterokaryon incompatibility protein-domain-containing protein n=1 Tax=Alternaria rosae TaxID=1187941 RepID=UPI001E8E2817|nr:heterokaryon incompatibility protein-domain-containing protein [Alternaria rosae]KAH6859114.1 heterokaryon incompatibility protein-domain-containing protein [Alternaria rosae]
MDIPSYQYESLPAPDHIRLITILPGDCGLTIKLGIEHADINLHPKYECLSYAWGTDDHKRPVTINASSLPVTATLHVALEHLRHRSQERKIWIDAICVNQRDIAERNSQVAIMRKIYQNAMRVIVWIGPATASNEKAMEFLKMMAKTKKNPRLPSPPRDHDDQLDFQDGQADLDHHDKAMSSDEKLLSLHVLSLELETNERPRPLHSAGALCSSQNRADSPNYLKKLKSHLMELYKLLGQTFFRIEEPGLDPHEAKRREQQEARAIEEAMNNDFAVSGFPRLYYTLVRPYDQYYQNAREPHWKSLNELLARPWWGRTWIVQEVWCASDAALQCGSTMIKWKTFQKAMDYTEAWDEMGESVKGMKRQLQWDTLRRRYTLAIHLTKARVNGSSLLLLLWNTWDRASTDPRDKVFVVLGLVGDAEGVSMAPDYRKPMEQVYKETARDIMGREGRMDILLTASGIHGDDGLPSWVPDWRREANAKEPVLLFIRHLLMKLAHGESTDLFVLLGHGYRAAGNSEAFASFSEGSRVLTVLSRKLDSLAEVWYVDIVAIRDDEFINRAFDFILQSEFVSTKARRKVSVEREQPPHTRDGSLLLMTLTGGGNQRRLFVTKNGHIGICPVDAQSRDMVFIISDCNVTIVFRPSNSMFAVVGEAYMHSYMAGEALARPWYERWMRTWTKISMLLNKTSFHQHLSKWDSMSFVIGMSVRSLA